MDEQSARPAARRSGRPEPPGSELQRPRPRDGAARRDDGAKTAAAKQGNRRKRNLTGRAMVLGAVVVLLALVLAAPLQRYLSQRDALAQAEHDRASATAKVAALQQLENKWQDPRYVEQQARSRLQFARPGDTVYVVIDPKLHESDPSAGQNSPASTADDATTWQTKAWASLQNADRSR